MRRSLRSITLATLVMSAATTASPQVRLADFIQVLGRVTNAAIPVENALIIALNLSNFTAIQTQSGRGGEFRLPPLQAGVYRIIAVKEGFAPSSATVLPVRKDHQVALQLRPDRDGTLTKNDEIWAIRSSLPSDVLRELENVYQPLIREAEASRFQAQMFSLAGLDPDNSTSSFARTAVGLSGDLGRGWKVDFEGNLDRIDDANSEMRSATGTGESRAVTMEVSSSPEHSYRIASMRSTWRYRDPYEQRADDHFADLQSHNFIWQYADSKVQVRYLSQENLFGPRDESELFEVSGERLLHQSDRSQLGVSVRLGQETLGRNELATPYRTADLAASGRYEPSIPVVVHYGLRSRLSDNGSEWTPESRAEIRLHEQFSLVLAGSYKILEEGEGMSVPGSVLLWNQTESASPRYAYSLALIVGNPDTGRLEAVAGVTAVDSWIRLMFDERFGPLWDGVYLQPGDLRHDVSVSFRKNIGSRLAVDVATKAGSARADDDANAVGDRSYIVGVIQTAYRPSGTSVDLSYRRIEQQARGDLFPDLAIDRVNLQMAQSLRLPLDLRLLFGLELARTDSSALMYDAELHRRFLGGVSLAF